ncbi:hypothetical protein B0T21DRAFT_407412 [Apiosordaria backusii]|uniref:Protein kinase domain-containing protein n=1 Tax=Apiosordaria backusii TaxID=314023 RepID=A0AA40K389_9PEZI|nr:hypothetical protein B0T21DRAFT_407412 [Apiosordaria backusii]
MAVPTTNPAHQWPPKEQPNHQPQPHSVAQDPPPDNTADIANGVSITPPASPILQNNIPTAPGALNGAVPTIKQTVHLAQPVFQINTTVPALNQTLPAVKQAAQSAEAFQTLNPPLSTVSDPRALPDQIPGVKGQPQFISHKSIVEWKRNAAVPTEIWTEEEYNKRFLVISKEMNTAVNKDPDLRDRSKWIEYSYRMVGPSRETAKPCIIVYCFKEDFERLEKLFSKRVKDPLLNGGKQSLVSRLFRGRDERRATVPPFGLVYYRRSKRTTGAEGMVPAYLSNNMTWSGKIVKSPTKTATLGLTVQIGSLSGVTTVDHIFPPEIEFPEDSDEVRDDSEYDYSDSDDMDMDLWVDTGVEYLDEYEEDDLDGTGSHQPIPHQQDGYDIWERIQPPFELPRNEAYLDWCLSKPVDYPAPPLPNLYYPCGEDAGPTIVSEIAKAPRFHCVPVHMLSAVRGVLSGELLAKAAMIGSGPGRDLCLVWTVILHSATKIVDGESGSLIIDQETKQIYGHVVGSEPSGNGYVVPMISIFAQIEARFRTSSVQVFKPLGEAIAPSVLEQEAMVGREANAEPASATPILSRSAPNILHAVPNRDATITPPMSGPTSDLMPMPRTDDSNAVGLGLDTVLSNAMMQAMVISASGKEFLPRSVLSTILPQEEVNFHLQTCLRPRLRNRDIQRWYASRICSTQRPFLKIFAILVLLGKMGCILDFIDEDVTDEDLPFVPPPGSKGVFSDLRLQAQPNVAIRCFQRWSIFHVRLFESTQWPFLAPVFTIGIEPYGRESVNGMIGVSKVQIHPDHHVFSTQGNVFGTMYISCPHDNIEEEVKYLNFAATRKQPDHVTPVLAVISNEGLAGYRLIFPWPEAMLSTYWEQINPNPIMTVDTVRWFVKQCAGLATAMFKLHGESSMMTLGFITERAENLTEASARYVYGNVRPESILWFPDSKKSINDMGKLCIAGFGVFSRPYIPNPRYRAPELELKRPATLESDIWSLGCIYLELVTWLLGGWKLLSTVLDMSFQPLDGGHISESDALHHTVGQNGEEMLETVAVGSEASYPSIGLTTRG